MKKVAIRRNSGYAEERNFVSLFEGYQKTRDVGHFGTIIWFILSGKAYQPFWQGFFYNPFLKVPLHSFNTIPLDSRRFIVHYETTIPRLGKNGGVIEKVLVRKLASDNCIQLIAISEAAKNLQREFLKANHPENMDGIMAKTIVLHPPQKVLVNIKNHKENADDFIRFCFVGRDFARKGGFEIITALSKIEREKWRLTIISDFNLRDYATHLSEEEIVGKSEFLREFLNDFSDNIELHEKIENTKVIELIKGSDVGLLPTWADSYGYSCLEFQACGCPVISTDVRSLPEINNDKCGWVIPVAKNNTGLDAKLNTDEDRLDFSNHLSKKLSEIFKTILTNPDGRIEIYKKGLNAIDRIKINHNPEDNINVLRPLINHMFD
ncbi:MAG: glycosyltransferase family 4 protein [Flavobacteriales bacterium]|nr:glycosyltransferase family 4 protein [Flavobacteriales bacterium]